MCIEMNNAGPKCKNKSSNNHSKNLRMDNYNKKNLSNSNYTLNRNVNFYDV